MGPVPLDELSAVARRRAAMSELSRLRDEQRVTGVRISRQEVRTWINEGRE